MHNVCLHTTHAILRTMHFHVWKKLLSPLITAVIGFEEVDYRVEEGDVKMLFRVRILSGIPNRDVVVLFNTEGGTADGQLTV